jgi:penicillin-binding protein 1A
VSQKGYTQEYAQNLIFTQGLQIYTTENPTIQGIMDGVYTNDKYWPLGDDGTAFQSSMLIVDYSGRVVGMEGGRGVKTGDMLKNRATSTKFYRTPGSSFKPIATYSLALEKGILNWSSMFLDSPITLHGKQWPRDDDGWSNTNMTVDYALTQSINCVAVKVEQQVTSSASYNFLTSKLGFTSLTKTPDAQGDSDYTSLGIAIGSLQNGVNAEEMAGAYEIFGDSGVYNKPYTYTKVLDADGNVLLQNKPAAIQAITPATSEIMNHLLQDVVAKGTGYAAQLGNVPQAGKTGTSNDSKDRWFVGLTPEYVGAVWTGYDPIKPNVGLGGTNPACIAWQAIFSQIEQGRDTSKDFPTSGDVVQKTYDPKTGKIDAYGSAVGWYMANDPTITKSQQSMPPATPHAKLQPTKPHPKKPHH